MYLLNSLVFKSIKELDGKPIATHLVASLDESEQRSLFLAKVLSHGKYFVCLIPAYSSWQAVLVYPKTRLERLS